MNESSSPPAKLFEKPVVCIHGFLSFNYTLMHLDKFVLKKRGFSVFNWGYPSRDRTIEGHATSLVNTLQEISKSRATAQITPALLQTFPSLQPGATTSPTISPSPLPSTPSTPPAPSAAPQPPKVAEPPISIQQVDSEDTFWNKYLPQQALLGIEKAHSFYNQNIKTWKEKFDKFDLYSVLPPLSSNSEAVEEQAVLSEANQIPSPSTQQSSSSLFVHQDKGGFNYVTHSFGAVVLRKAMNHPDCPPEAKYGKAVLIAPCNRGAVIARNLAQNKFLKDVAEAVVGPHAGRELMTLSQEDFASIGEFPPTLKVLVIAGNLFPWHPLIPGVNDGTLALEETRPHTPHQYLELTASHNAILFHPKTLRATVDFLEGTYQDPPKPQEAKAVGQGGSSI